jgi:hypothetical protein
MTAQISDIVFYKGEEYALAGCSGGEPFIPAEYGYFPVMGCTACWRGYLSEYEIRDGYLLLRRLNINHQLSEDAGSQPERPPALYGVEAEESDKSYIGRWAFSDLDLPLKYSGRLILARGLIRELYNHMGFHPAWKYERVYEIIFESGKMISEHDQSAGMAEIRDQMRNQSAPGADL